MPLQADSIAADEVGLSVLWRGLAAYGDAPALLEFATGRRMTYRDLAASVRERRDTLKETEPGLVVFHFQNRLDDVLWYLGALAAGHAPLLLDRAPSAAIVEAYRPAWIYGEAQVEPGPYDHVAAPGAILRRRRTRDAPRLHPQLGLLLTTSGSTGGRKVVRLSRANVEASIEQVRSALGLDGGHKVATTLPLAYVYGLSVLQSHLASGAEILIDDRSVVDPAFWRDAAAAGMTTLPGVPWTFEVLRRAGAERAWPASLARATVAGGALAAPTRQWLFETLRERGGALYVMYGQAEAAGRIAVLPPELAQAKPGSCGRSVPGGRLRCEADGEVVFQGPNVMMGYAETAHDLARGDEMQGRLRTGDIGRLDEDGCLTISGRKNRYCKLFGARVSLDEVESWFSDLAPTAVLSLSETELTVVFDDADREAILSRHAVEVAAKLRVPRRAVVVRRVAALARGPGGKPAYDLIARSLLDVARPQPLAGEHA